jgi:hypothetical protein
MIKIRKFKQPAKTQNHSLAGNPMFIAVAFAQPEVGMGVLLCYAIFPDCLDVHTAKDQP